MVNIGAGFESPYIKKKYKCGANIIALDMAKLDISSTVAISDEIMMSFGS